MGEEDAEGEVRLRDGQGQMLGGVRPLESFPEFHGGNIGRVLAGEQHSQICMLEHSGGLSRMEGWVERRKGPHNCQNAPGKMVRVWT